MERIMKRGFLILFVTVLFASSVLTQTAPEKIDTAVISRIKDEGLNRSQVMEILSFLTDVYGPRLTWSPEYREAAQWASGKLNGWGLQNVHDDRFGPVGKGWTLKRFSANVLSPRAFPVIGYPKAWSPSTKGTVRGPVVHLEAKTEEELAPYRGKLRNAFVLVGDARELGAHFFPQATRLEDSALLNLANAGPSEARAGRLRDSAAANRFVATMQFNARRMEFCMNEGAAALIDAGRGDGGTVFVQQASVPRVPANISEIFTSRFNAYDPDAPKILPQVSLASEHYNRLVRMMKKGQRIQMEMYLEVEWTKPDSGFSVIGEIPGTDLKDEVVMIGAHFDSWQAATGATDNATGSVICMEAVRILRTLGLQPRRTIRIGLWGGEEQGLFGSREYVKKYLGERETDPGQTFLGRGGSGALKPKPQHDRFSVYFNNDNGTGKVRGVYLQGNEKVHPIFREWLAAIGDPTAQTLSLSNTGGTDHLPFDAVGLPGFQFIQDPIEYSTRTHHSNMDYYDRAQEEDLKQASIVMAVFAYQAAMREAKIPRKPAVVPGREESPSGSN
ncbi:MAG: M20/M25/M40 family metallo-hydrolase [Ignavibacteriales bacterium]|nr:M20/M25/M40 family metallo-hydrolase [Ignavibacteriales bacterium]